MNTSATQIFKMISLAMADFKDTLCYLSSLFVNVIDRKIYLLHQTGREFLLDRSKSSTWDHFDLFYIRKGYFNVLHHVLAFVTF